MEYGQPFPRHATPTSVPAPLTALRWSPTKVVLLVAWAAGLNVGQAFLLRALGVSSLPGEWPHFIRAVVVFAFYALIVAPVVISARRQGLRFRDAVGLREPHWPLAAGLALAAVFIGRALAIVWALVVVALRLHLPGGNPDITRLFGNSPAGIITTIVVAVFVGPFAEEVVFRGVAFAQLDRVEGFIPALFGSSVLFGLLHINALELVPLLAAGALFAWVFRVSRSLWTSVFAHSVFNLIAVIAVYSLKALGR